MAIVVNRDKLQYVLTKYGLSRIAEALADESVELNLYKVCVGDANGNFYVPSEEQTELVHAIPDGMFYISQKELLEDNLTVSLSFQMPETFGGCDIREVGLYETIDGEDHLFAVGTQQPIVKPASDFNYYILVDYYIMLKTANLAEVYDQIVLNPVQVIVTAEDFQNLISSTLFTQGNLLEQISGNSHIIGLNKATTLYELISKNTVSYSYVNTIELYSDLTTLVGVDNIFGYWSFNYPKENPDKSSIKDINTNQHDISTNKGVNNYPLDYVGLSSSLKFSDFDYYYISPNFELKLTDDDNKDIPFTFIFALNPNNYSSTKTLLARSNYATGTHAFEVKELSSQRLEIRLFTDENNYLTFRSDKGSIPTRAHSVIISYNPNTQSFISYVGGKEVFFNKTEVGRYSHISTTPTTIYGFECEDVRNIYANSGSTNVTKLYNADGTPYTGSIWSIHSGVVFYNNDIASYDELLNEETVQLYAWASGNNLVYTKELNITKDTILYNEDYTAYSGDDFRVGISGSNYVVIYKDTVAERNASQDVAPYTLYAWSFNSGISKVWTNSVDTPAILFNANGTLYTGNQWTISDDKVVYETGVEGVHKEALDITLPSLSVTSYVTDSSGTNKEFIDSEVSLISVITNASLSNSDIRQISLRLEASLGNNPCIVLNQ